MADEVVAHTSAELTKLMRASAQIGRYMAMRSRMAMRNVEQVSTTQHQALTRALEQEKAHAAKIIAQTRKSEFWQETNVDAVAHAYGVATRFAPMDPAFAMEAQQIRRTASQVFGIDVAALKDRSASIDTRHVTAAELGRVAPTLKGEDPEAARWVELLDRSAELEREMTQAATTKTTPTVKGTVKADSVQALTAVQGTALPDPHMVSQARQAASAHKKLTR